MDISYLVDIGTFSLIISSIHVESGEPVGWMWKIFDTAFRALMVVKNGRAAEKKRKIHSDVRVRLPGRGSVNSILEKFHAANYDKMIQQWHLCQ